MIDKCIVQSRVLMPSRMHCPKKSAYSISTAVKFWRCFDAACPYQQLRTRAQVQDCRQGGGAEHGHVAQLQRLAGAHDDERQALLRLRASEPVRIN